MRKKRSYACLLKAMCIGITYRAASCPTAAVKATSQLRSNPSAEQMSAARG